MGFFDAFKKSRSEVNRENRYQGKSGEDQTRSKWEFNGYETKRTGRGHDFKATKRDWLSGQKETKYVEVKTGKSRLSKLQKKKKRQLGGKYVVERLEPTPFGLSSTNMFGRFSSSSRKKGRSRKKKADSIWGTGSSYDSLFGTGSSKRKSRRKSGRKSDDWSIW